MWYYNFFLRYYAFSSIADQILLAKSGLKWAKSGQKPQNRENFKVARYMIVKFFFVLFSTFSGKIVSFSPFYTYIWPKAIAS